MGMRFHSPKHVVETWLVNNHQRLKRVLPDRYSVFRYPGGRIYWNPGNSPGMLARVLGIYEVEKMAVLKQLKPGSTFVDVGANVGDFALLAARMVGQEGKVLCFEPEPRNCHWLQRAIDLNGYRNTEIYEVALSDQNGKTQLYLGEIAGYHSLIQGLPNRQSGTITVTTRTLDSLLEEVGQDRVDMMKIDVEGAELQVLNGSRATLQKNPDMVLLIELHPGLGVNYAEVCDFLGQLGFSESGPCWRRNTGIPPALHSGA